MSLINDHDSQLAKQHLELGCDQMEQLLKNLLISRSRVGENVHSIRKLGKSLRGGFCLFRLEETAGCEIQAIGRLLSAPRDAVSRRNTWKKIGWDDPSSASAAITGLLDQQTRSASKRPPAESIAWCLERLNSARNQLAELSSENLAANLDQGLDKLKKRVNKRCKLIDPSGKHDFHDARKAVKAYLGALGFLPTGTPKPKRKMLELAELLGDENDLTTFSAWLEEHGFTEKFIPGLWEKLEAARKKLRVEAMRDAEQLIAD